MIDISTEVSSILSNSRGEDVRDSIVEACRKISTWSLPDVTEEDVGKKMIVTQDGKWSLEVMQNG